MAPRSPQRLSCRIGTLLQLPLIALAALTLACFKGGYEDLYCMDDMSCGGTLKCINNKCGTVGVDCDPDKVAQSERAVATSHSHTCALMECGDLRCWGSNTWGQLGQDLDPPVTDDPCLRPATRIPLGPADGLPIAQVTLGGYSENNVPDGYTCVSFTNGKAKCWGKNRLEEPPWSGWLGYGETDPVPSTEDFIPIDSGLSVTQISAGYVSTCAIVEHVDHIQSLTCWGVAEEGGHLVFDIIDPKKPENYKSVIVGPYHGCALRQDDSLSCWGQGKQGQVGVAWDNPGCKCDHCKIVDLDQPGMPLEATPIKLVGLGLYHTCAVTKANKVWCWGDDTQSQLGSESSTGKEVCYPLELDTTKNPPACIANPEQSQEFTCSYSPLLAESVNETLKTGDEILELVSGSKHNCILVKTSEESNDVRCWGVNSYGQLASTEPKKSSVPLTVAFEAEGKPIHLAAHLGDHTCAVFDSGELWCWGDNRYGQVDRCQAKNPPEPMFIASPTRVFPKPG